MCTRLAYQINKLTNTSWKILFKNFFKCSKTFSLALSPLHVSTKIASERLILNTKQKITLAKTNSITFLKTVEQPCQYVFPNKIKSKIEELSK